MIGASNNLYKKGDIIVGDNTDCIGLAKDINQNLGFDLYGKEILILEQEAQPKELLWIARSKSENHLHSE